MAGGIVYIKQYIEGVPRNVAYWSDDGTLTGNLSPEPVVAQVSSSNPATVAAGQKKIATTGTAVAIAASTPLINGVIVTALDTNLAKITVGATGVGAATDGTGTGYVLAPGQSISFGVTDLASVFINGTAGDGASFAGN